MATADSTIRVAITGDAKGLGKAVDAADKKLGAFGGSAAKLGGVVAAAFAADAVVDFAKTALSEADRVGDSVAVLTAQLGTDLTNALEESAKEFHTLGLSKGDVLELEGAVADVATALGLSKDNIAKLAPDLVTAAGALSLISDKSPDEVIDLIGKAAGGSLKAMKELGILVSDEAVNQQAMLDTGKDLPEQLTDTEKAAARYKIVLEKLQPKIQAVTDAQPDLESSTRDVQARFETLTGELGEHLQGPLNDFLQWVLDGIDYLGDLQKEFDPTGEKLEGFAKIVGESIFPLEGFVNGLSDMVGFLGDLIALDLDSLARRLGNVGKAGKGGNELGSDLGGLGGGSIPGVHGPTPEDSHQSGPGSVIPTSITINVPPTGAQTEAAVVRALRDYQQRNGTLA